jgi:hypothetical protein
MLPALADALFKGMTPHPYGGSSWCFFAAQVLPIQTPPLVL